MRISNQLDGAYFFLLFVPFLLSFWVGDLLRKKIVHHLLLERSWSHSLSAVIGFALQSLIMIIGVLIGFFLTKLIEPNFKII